MKRPRYIACGLLLVLGLLFFLRTHASITAVPLRDPDYDASVSRLEDVLRPPSSTRTRAATQLDSQHSRVAGLVLDQDNNPIPGVTIYLGPAGQPIGEEVGVYVISDEKGVFSAEIPVLEHWIARAVRLTFAGSIHHDPTRDKNTPIDLSRPTELRIYLMRIVHAQLDVLAMDAATGTRLVTFSVAVETPGGWFLKQTSEAGKVRCKLPVVHPGTPVTVRLGGDSSGASLQSLLMDPGGKYAVLLNASGNAVVYGFAVDIGGNPIEGADVRILRANESQGSSLRTTKTDPAGWFQLGAEIADHPLALVASHPSFSTTSVTLSSPVTILLASRSRIVGTFGHALATSITSARLDSGEVSPVSSDGQFAFSSVDAGRRGVWFGDRAILYVDVPPGETVTLDLSSVVSDAEIRLTSSANIDGSSTGVAGTMIGIRNTSCCVAFTARDGVIRSGPVLPGEYVLAFNDGGLAFVSVLAESPVRTITVEAHGVELSGTPGGRFLIDTGDRHIERWAIDRRPNRFSSDGVAMIRYLQPGTYIVRDLDNGTETSLTVEPNGAVRTN